MTDLRWHGDELAHIVEAAAMRGVVIGIGMVEERAVELITSGPKTGRIYRRRGVEHQASAPGEAPASDTGTLVNARRIDLFPDRSAARLTFTSLHAPYLQFGTRNMEPRPFADRALAERKDDVKAAIAAEVSGALK